ncbi:MAG: ribosomal L7Ae/L30e/S12e/Gadd45 family protein [Nanoarchaeota archaeon]|nr:ribosomal L7Ae/L30e/S12e/Gadd45 family protein [Nanoarchaeota archaeon]MBU1632684.1 ribosomal L7Ae/L30e/S12e/Gadd45 family protein [Nanoarchaeota archaeon]MBU1876302.1 ribosomal L7Ae/L30e/S12e/Gadd45 family protein [Nanoarchaeota archaeon]
MAKKEEIETEIKELKTKVQEGKAIIGKDEVLKWLKDKKLNKVFVASNCPPKIREDIGYYAKLAEVPVLDLNLDNEELGIFCKKNFFVMVLGTIEE